MVQQVQVASVSNTCTESVMVMVRVGKNCNSDLVPSIIFLRKMSSAGQIFQCVCHFKWRLHCSRQSIDSIEQITFIVLYCRIFIQRTYPCMSMLKALFAPINGPLLHSDTFSSPWGVYNPSCLLGARFFLHITITTYRVPIYTAGWTEAHTFLTRSMPVGDATSFATHVSVRGVCEYSCDRHLVIYQRMSGFF